MFILNVNDNSVLKLKIAGNSPQYFSFARDTVFYIREKLFSNGYTLMYSVWVVMHGEILKTLF